MYFLDNTPNQPSKFKIKNWVEIYDESWWTYNEDNQIKSKTLLLRSSLCDYGDAYILVKGTMTIEPTTAAVSNSANN